MWTFSFLNVESWDGCVVVEWLSKLEIFTVLFRKSIVTIKSEFCFLGNKFTSNVSPDKFFDWVVEVKFNLLGGRLCFFLILKLFNEVFV